MYSYSDDPSIKSRDYRNAVVPHYDYIIIFRIEETSHTVYIMRYFHELELFRNKL